MSLMMANDVASPDFSNTSDIYATEYIVIYHDDVHRNIKSFSKQQKYLVSLCLLSNPNSNI